jgi:hypothetical protein
VRQTWWVALLFLLPSLLLTLLINSALFLQRGFDAPVVWIGVLLLPIVATGKDPKRAFARGLFVMAALALLFATVVHLRLWTQAGGPVLEREGLLPLSRWALVLAAAAGAGGFFLSRPSRAAS